MKDIGNVNVSFSIMYRFLSVMLFSNVAELSLSMVVPVLKGHIGVPIPLETMTFLHQNILAYPSPGRGTGPSRV